MKHYDLDLYEAIITEHVSNVSNQSAVGKAFQHIQKLIVQAYETTRCRMRSRLLPPREFELYVHRHQAAIVDLKDLLLEKMGVQYALDIWQEKDMDAGKMICKTLYRSLEQLLAFVEEFFSRFIDIDRKVPEAKRIFAMHNREQAQELIKKRLAEAGINTALQDVIFAPQELSIKKQYLTRSSLIYQQLLVEELTAFTSVKQTCTEDILVATLRYLNFNSYDFFNYITTGWARQQAAIGSFDEQLLWLKNCRSNNQFKDVKPGIAFHELLLPLKDSLDLWLEIEYNYISERINASMKHPDAKETESLKMVTDMPVEQLVYLRRLEMEVDKAPKPSVSTFCRFIANSYSTVRKEKVSEKNIRLCFYNFTLTTKEQAENRLYEMIKRSKGM